MCDESNILHETKNLYLYKANKKLEIRLNNESYAYSIVVGSRAFSPENIEKCKMTMNRLENNIETIKKIYFT
jgi:hypothetical protein